MPQLIAVETCCVTMRGKPSKIRNDLLNASTNAGQHTCDRPAVCKIKESTDLYLTTVSLLLLLGCHSSYYARCSTYLPESLFVGGMDQIVLAPLVQVLFDPCHLKREQCGWQVVLLFYTATLAVVVIQSVCDNMHTSPAYFMPCTLAVSYVHAGKSGDVKEEHYCCYRLLTNVTDKQMTGRLTQ